MLLDQVPADAPSRRRCCPAMFSRDTGAPGVFCSGIRRDRGAPLSSTKRCGRLGGKRTESRRGYRTDHDAGDDHGTGAVALEHGEVINGWVDVSAVGQPAHQHDCDSYGKDDEAKNEDQGRPPMIGEHFPVNAAIAVQSTAYTYA